MKEKLTKAEFVEMFEIAWNSTCQSNYSYIEEVGAEQALQDEWDSMMDGLQEDYTIIYQDKTDITLINRFIDKLSKVVKIHIERE